MCFGTVILCLMESGIDMAWGMLLQREATDVCRDTPAEHDQEGGCYRLVSLGHEFMLCPEARSVTGTTPQACTLRERHSLYLDHALVWYMAAVGGMGKDIGRSGRLIRPSDLKGGHHFFTRGTHVLPLGELAARHGADAEGFLDKGQSLGGTLAQYADAAIELLPMPRVPVLLMLWLGDDEFPARADLLFDSSAEFMAPLDVLWAAAMLSVAAML